MRRLILHMAISADGFVGGPNGEIDWIFKTIDEEATSWSLQAVRKAGVHIMGRRTFHDMAAYWPYSDEPFAAPMNKIPKVVFSRNPLEAGKGQTTTAFKDASRAASKPGRKGATAKQSALAAKWISSQVAAGSLEEEISKLKEQPGKYILAHGGASFARSLVASGQVDEYRLRMHPVFLGRGLSLFSGLSMPLDLRLLSSDRFKKGVVGLVYRPA